MSDQIPQSGRLQAPNSPVAPTADIRPHKGQWHGEDLSDNYFWLKDQGYPKVTDTDVLDYLKRENAYFEEMMADKKTLCDQIFAEVRGRVKEDDAGVPYVDGDYDYQWSFEAGAQYRQWARRPKGTGQPFSIYFDEVAAAEGLDFFKLADLAVSPDGTLLAWSADTNGSERFTIQVKNLVTGEMLADTVAETSGEIIWDAAGQGFFYVIVSKEWRPFEVRYHRLGSTGTDPVIYHEKDSSFFVHISRTSSQEWLVIRSADHVTAENRVLHLARGIDNLVEDLRLIAPRTAGHDYDVDHGWHGHALDPDGQGLFIIRSNRDHSNFDLLVQPVTGDPGGAWQPLVRGDASRYIHGYHVFKNFIAILDRIEGLDQLTILTKGGDAHTVQFAEDVYECGLGANCVYDTDVVRVTYTSMITPNSVFDYHVSDRQLSLLKEQEIPSGYNKGDYRTSRIMITARDGVKVPVSIVHHKDWQKGRGAPLHLYGYGAYGLGMSPSFSSARLSLLDRGFVYAIAHIRGGDEMGYDWYKAGKLENRTNTFNDFVDCARGLVDIGYAAEGEISISGGSAGGELMGAVLNQAPDLFKGAVLHVPFVDVLNTMLDDSLPLTPIEWPEWGNPIESQDDYALIKSYCPYTNMGNKAYPPQLITGGLNDPRVTYWEPAKWTAKMRVMTTSDSLIMMKMNMGAGHGGKSGRFERLMEVAEEYTFLLMCFGKD